MVGVVFRFIQRLGVLAACEHNRSRGCMDRGKEERNRAVGRSLHGDGLLSLAGRIGAPIIFGSVPIPSEYLILCGLLFAHTVRAGDDGVVTLVRLQRELLGGLELLLLQLLHLIVRANRRTRRVHRLQSDPRRDERY